MLVNTGPAVATNVRALIHPLLPSDLPSGGAGEQAQQRLNVGISSVPPGRQIAWSLGLGSEILNVEEMPVYSVRMKADGPDGPIPDLTYELNLLGMRETLDDPPGNLHQVRRSLDAIVSQISPN